MKKLLKVAIWCIGLLTLAFYGIGRSQNPVLPPSNIVQQALRFADGYPLAFQGKAKIAWQECYIFSGDIGNIYVDTLTGQVTTAFYKLSVPRGGTNNSRGSGEESEILVNGTWDNFEWMDIGRAETL